MGIEYIDLVKQVRDVHTNSTKLGFHANEGYAIDFEAHGFRITHPDKSERRVYVPISNVASWRETTEPAPKKGRAA